MFERLESLPEDPILGVMDRCRADPSVDKLDLGVGVYRDENGHTPVLRVVRQAEQEVLQRQTTKAYVSASGNAAFNAALERLVLGVEHVALTDDRVRSVQTPGGCGALRLGAEVVRSACPTATALISDPSWPNHVPLVRGAGLGVETYPYFDKATARLQFDALIERLQRLPTGSIVLVQAGCHNPTGVDLSSDQWRELAKVLAARGLVPFVDMAYQGLGESPADDAAGLRLLAQEVPELLIAVSCSKNFGLYRERVGALLVVGAHRRVAEAMQSHAIRSARALYSMPPDHGAAIVARILDEPGLLANWQGELRSMAMRLRSVRIALAEALEAGGFGEAWSSVAAQRGLFSLLPLNSLQIERLRQEHHIYMGLDGRINVAGLVDGTVEPFVRALRAVTSRT